MARSQTKPISPEDLAVGLWQTVVTVFIICVCFNALEVIEMLISPKIENLPLGQMIPLQDTLELNRNAYS